MANFDFRTALIIVGLLYLIMPTMAWVVLKEQRPNAVALWCGGGLTSGLGLLLIGLRGSVPDVVSYAFANSLMLIGTLARIQSLRLDLNLPWRIYWMSAGFLIYILIFEVIRQFLKNDVLRLLYGHTIWASLLIYLSMLALRIAKKDNSQSAKWIAYVYFLVVAALLYRIYTLQSGIGSTNVLASGLDSQLIGLTLVLASVVGHIGYVGLALDRSIRREVSIAATHARNEESRRLGDQIAQLDRQRSLGEMSASLGHELNQPLTAILTNAQVAKRGVKDGRFDSTQLLDFLEKIIHNTQRASQIVERIRDFIRPVATRRESVDLDHIVREVIELVADEAKSCNITLSIAPVDFPVMVTGDPIQLSQIVLNVVRNAIQGLAQVVDRKIHFVLSNEDDRAILRIRDSGPGIPPEVLSQVGKPFFTTKSEGLGMGLSISCSIAKQHEGTLLINNAEGGGVQVELNLPALHNPTN